MSNPTNILLTNLNSATFWMNQIVPILQITFGTSGNLLSIMIFTRRSLRNNPCSMYFLAGSVNNCFVIYVSILNRYLANNWNWDPSATNTVLCKLRDIFMFPSLCLVLWFTVLASIDRFLSSSQHARLRRMSTLTIARKTVVFATIFMFLINSHVLVFATSSTTGRMTSCIYLSNEYLIFLNFFVSFVSCILPIVFMSIFGILVIQNVRSMRTRIAPHVDITRNGRLRSNDRQMIRMLLIQILTSVLFSVPFSVYLMYSAVAVGILKFRPSTNEQAIVTFTINIFQFLYHTTPVVGFYSYILSGPKFRVEMKLCIKYIFRSALQMTGLMRCLSLEVQQALFGDNQTGVNNTAATLKRRGNAIHPVRYQKSMNIISVE